MSANRWSLLLGITLCMSAVVIGAFGSHALATLLEINERQDTFEIANRYHFYQGLALLAFGAGQFRVGHVAVIALTLGTLIFSISLYSLSISNIGVFGAITPVGGVVLIVVWIAVFRDALGYRGDDYS